MKFKLQFDKEIYKKQMDLLFEIAWKEKIAYYKNSNYFGLMLVAIGLLLLLERTSFFGVAFIIFGLGILIPYFYYFFKIKKEYNGIENLKKMKIETLENLDEEWEFTEEGLIIKFQENERIFEWNEFVAYFVKKNNLFLITEKHEPIILDEIEVGEENFNALLNFIEHRIKLKV